MDHHDHATFSEKMRGAFDELDQNKQRGIPKEEWASAMKRLHIETASTEVTTVDLFDKLDLNRDGVLSFSEFQRFAELYPTMLDSIYYRSKDYWTELHQLDTVEKATRELEELRLREAEAIEALHDSQRQRDMQEQKVHTTDLQIAERRSEEERTQRSLQQAEEGTSLARQKVAAKSEEVVQIREQEREWTDRVGECQRTVEQLIETLKHQDAEVAQSEERLRSIERMLIEQKRDVEAKMQARDQVQYEVLTSQGREQTAHSKLVETQMLVQSAVQASAQAEAEVAALLEAERMAAQTLAGATAEVLKAQTSKEAELREYQQYTNREEQRLSIVEAARAATQTQGQAINSLEQRMLEFNQHRRVVESEEAPLLDQEALLREQRDSLEERENRLRSEVHVFTSHTGRSPATSPRVSVKMTQPPIPNPSPSPSVVPPPGISASGAGSSASASGVAPVSSYTRGQRAEPYQVPQSYSYSAAQNLTAAVAAVTSSAASLRDPSLSFSPSRLRASALAASRLHY